MLFYLNILFIIWTSKALYVFFSLGLRTTHISHKFGHEALWSASPYEYYVSTCDFLSFTYIAFCPLSQINKFGQKARNALYHLLSRVRLPQEEKRQTNKQTKTTIFCSCCCSVVQCNKVTLFFFSLCKVTETGIRKMSVK